MNDFIPRAGEAKTRGLGPKAQKFAAAHEKAAKAKNSGSPPRFDLLEWTDSNHVRHIKFLAMRDDKDPRKVVREA